MSGEEMLKRPTVRIYRHFGKQGALALTTTVELNTLVSIEYM